MIKILIYNFIMLILLLEVLVSMAHFFVESYLLIFFPLLFSIFNVSLYPFFGP